MKNIENTENQNNVSSPLISMVSYAESLQYLYDRLPVFHQVGGSAYKPGLDNSVKMMNNLGNPQNSYRTIHIAGTNGKGSVSNFLAAVLQKAGYKVGLYTSPHLYDFRERIRVNGEKIDKQFIINFVEQNKDLFNEIEPSFFEATMAMAFDYFAFCQVDVSIIEVGLGGRLDSTNIIRPELSVITNISFDHIGFLGNTLEKIAFEKAGIIKPDTTVVIGEALPETRTVFELKAQQENAPIFFAEEKYTVSFKEFIKSKMLIETSDKKLLKIGLSGVYQLKNIATALAAIEQLKHLNFEISETALQDGFENVVEITGIQGRWQELQKSPTVVCDTGHNVGGIKFVVKQLKLQKYKTLRVVIGMVSDKDISGVMTLLPSEALYYFTQASIVRALPSEELKQRGLSYGLTGSSYTTVKLAIKAALHDAGPDDFIFIGGSNFVVGEALANFAD
jgi:dihydrofolate synthase/folylpolyglutamate synthase